MATELIPLAGVRIEELADAAQLASLADETPEGARSWCWSSESYAPAGDAAASSARTFIPSPRRRA